MCGNTNVCLKASINKYKSSHKVYFVHLVEFICFIYLFFLDKHKDLFYDLIKSLDMQFVV